jgi:hypothetical protein
LKGWHSDTGSEIYFKIILAEAEKIATFAARFGRTESQLNLAYEKQAGKEEDFRKIKFILFVILKNFLTFATPTETKGKQKIK